MVVCIRITVGLLTKRSSIKRNKSERCIIRITMII